MVNCSALFSPYPLEMSLQFVLGIVALLDALVEVVVDWVEHAPHLVSAWSEQGIDFTTETLRCLTFLLWSSNVLLSEADPWVGDGDAERGDTRNIGHSFNPQNTHCYSQIREKCLCGQKFWRLISKQLDMNSNSSKFYKLILVSC